MPGVAGTQGRPAGGRAYPGLHAVTPLALSPGVAFPPRLSASAREPSRRRHAPNSGHRPKPKPKPKPEPVPRFLFLALRRRGAEERRGGQGHRVRRGGCGVMRSRAGPRWTQSPPRAGGRNPVAVVSGPTLSRERRVCGYYGDCCRCWQLHTDWDPGHNARVPYARHHC
jgi:hypothetical protein